MNIYFAGSIRGGRHHQDTYKAIINALQDQHTVLSEHVGNESLTETGQAKPATTIHDQDLAWIHEADAVIADVTQPSHGVGYEIAKAEGNKPILCLHNQTQSNISAMIQGAEVTTKQYQDSDEAINHAEEFLKHV